MKLPLPIAILISGGGSTAEAIIKSTQFGILKGLIDPKIVISSNSKAPGLQKAKDLGIATEIVRPRDYVNPESFGIRLLEIFQKSNITFISQNGWLAMTPSNVIEEYKGKVINQHPGPLDNGRNDFGGKGMYGARVTCAVLAFSWITKKLDFTESTVHHVTKNYDEGKIIDAVRMAIPLLNYETSIEGIASNPKYIKEKVESIQTKLLPLEHLNVIHVLESIALEKELGFERDKFLVEDSDQTYLNMAKELAINLYPNG